MNNFYTMQAQFQETDNRTPLEKYTINLTDLAKDGKIDPVIGREDEIYRTIQILSRRSKNNPVLV
jgi:ATP-dependent Clp protease ATP-binding subunit ClpB